MKAQHHWAAAADNATPHRLLSCAVAVSAARMKAERRRKGIRLIKYKAVNVFNGTGETARVRSVIRAK